MAKVIGIGGVFFRSDDPKALRSWYASHLGLTPPTGGQFILPWRHEDDPEKSGMTIWSAFPRATDYFGPTRPEFMINYIVDDLHGMLAELRASGASVDEKVDDSEYGRFGWVTDPEGNRIELWEPPK